jgi:hypothetical protein
MLKKSVLYLFFTIVITSITTLSYPFKKRKAFLEKIEQQFISTHNELFRYLEIKNRFQKMQFNKRLLFELVCFFPMQEEIVRLEKLRAHIGIANRTAFLQRLAFLKAHNRLKLKAHSLPNKLQLDLQNPCELAQKDLEKLLRFIQDECVDLLEIDFEKQKRFDQEVFLLKSLKLAIYLQ